MYRSRKCVSSRSAHRPQRILPRLSELRLVEGDRNRTSNRLRTDWVSCSSSRGTEAVVLFVAFTFGSEPPTLLRYGLGAAGSGAFPLMLDPNVIGMPTSGLHAA